MKYFVTINGKKYEVVIEQESSGNSVATIASNPEAVAPRNAPEVSPGGAAGEESITAPMPGTILKVKVKEGQPVKRGDILFVLEAMKMENEIMAGRDAIVSKVHVANGTSVNTGDCLALLK